ncbi:MAG TPA: glycosyltransferase [Nitrospira sp.]|nr:glycosyltransferase [Nitrospira sp.]
MNTSAGHTNGPLRPTIAVIIPVYNGGLKFRAALDSVRSAIPPPDELIVIGDGDTDGSAEYAQSSGAVVYRFDEPGGPGRARNLGASKAQSDLLFFVDADVTVPPRIIGQLRTIFSEHPGIAAVIGSYDDQPGERNFLSQYRNLLHHFVHQQGREDASTFWGACGAIRRSVFLEVGGFDERYTKPSIEDIELGYRLKRTGHSIRLSKSLYVKHWKRWDVGSMLRTDLFQRALPWTRLIHESRQLANDLNVDTSGRASVLLTWGMCGALLLSLWQPQALIALVPMAAALTALNVRLYRFFVEQRGWRFTLQAVPWHWLYFLYSGLGFAIGTLYHLLGSPRNHASGIGRGSTGMNFLKWGVPAALTLQKYGIRISRDAGPLRGPERRHKHEFLDRARRTYTRHLGQTEATVAALTKKYEKPVFGKVRVWDLIERLGQCIDPSDSSLYCVSQLVHALQVVDGMERDGIRDKDLLIAGFIHDLGKLLLLTGEAPEHVVCINSPIRRYEPGIGLDQCIFQWNHDQFVYTRFKDCVPNHLAWLLRYHSAYLPACEDLMDEQDRMYAGRYLETFEKYDTGTKSLYRLPERRMDEYRTLIEEAFPDPILF